VVSWRQRIQQAARQFDWQQLAEVVEEYVGHLRSTPEIEDYQQIRAILSLLRECRRYEELLRVADAALGHGLTDAAIKRQLAQALVDRDRPAAALLIFRSLIDDPGLTPMERIEAWGGVGRCHKQLYVQGGSPIRRETNLKRAVDAYRQAFVPDHRLIWHGINIVALLCRAGRDGIMVADMDDPAGQAARLAAEILEHISDMPEPDAWEKATASEAHLALGDHARSTEWAAQFTEDPGADSFKLASYLRQLLDVWQLRTDLAPGDSLLPILRSALLGRQGGAVVVVPTDVRATRVGDALAPGLERVLGSSRFQSLGWYRTGLERCRAVAQIENQTEDGIGTGFLVDGRRLHADLPATVLMTNGHVIPEAVAPGDAIVAFRGLDEDRTRQRFRVVRTWWYQQSERPGIDTVLLELDDYPRNVSPAPLANRLPVLDGIGTQRAYLIGHPNQLGNPQFSLQDNVILDYDETYVHYRAPSDRGSSGSPVFDSSWSLIALHHAGGFDTPRLHNKGGTYAANEGISLSAIVGRLRDRPPAPESVVR
jgi:V8-like Glu-specific endopeptidase